MIRKCTCKHESQDSIHGKYMRVFNRIKGNTKDDYKVRCTVCRKEINVPADEYKKG
jgi:hypothetical protein